MAALSRMYRGNMGSIGVLTKLDPLIWKLAALQNTDPDKLDLQGLTIDIDRASDDVLRLALITVGLNRDIENLFHPRHSNREFVKRLATHPDLIVQQYSVWSVIENRRLVFEDLGVSLDEIEKLAPNVQAKVYQLIAERDPDLRRRISITETGSINKSSDAREGLSKGIRKSFYDGLEEVTLGWFDQETSPIVRENLAEHFARFSADCAPYEAKAFQINEADPGLRSRLLLGAEGKPLYGKLKAEPYADLFSGDNTDHILNTLRSTMHASQKIIKVLLIAASPVDQPRLRLEKEQKDILQAIKKVSGGKVRIDFSMQVACAVEDIIPSLLGADADVFHFSGHGNTEGIMFETSGGFSQVVDGVSIAEYLLRLKKSPSCIILNACYSDALARALSARSDTVIGCNSKVNDDAAIRFSGSFYSAMGNGLKYGDCFHIAVQDVRTVISDIEARKFCLWDRTRS